MSAKRKATLTPSLTPRWKPRPYQKKTVELGLKRKFLALFLDPGLGKTSIMLQIFNLLKIRKQAKGLLVIAPLNPCYMTWPEQIKGWTNFRRFSYSVLHGRDKDKMFNKKVDIYIINPEGMPWLLSKLKGKRKKDWPFDMLAVDESGKFKTYSSSRSKLLHRIAPAFNYRYIANGTPVGNGYMGLMSQMRIVDQGHSLGSKIGQYRAKYFDQVGRPEWASYVLKPGAKERIMKRISPFAVCLRAEDHVDMPRRVVQTKHIALPPRALRVYEDIERELFAEIDNHELVAESSVSLANKLHQICSGAVYVDQDPLALPVASNKREVITLHSEKLKVVENLLDEYNGKPILLGYKFTHDKKALKKYFGSRIIFFDDMKTGPDKVKLQKKWNSGGIELLAGNPQSVGHGLNLQKGSASLVCFYSLDHDNEDHDQFIRRVLRNGNKSKTVHTIYIRARGLYDDLVVYPNLCRKERDQQWFFESLINYRNKRRADK